MKKILYYFGLLWCCFSCYTTPVSFKLNQTDNPFFIGCFLTPNEPLRVYFYPIKPLPYNLINLFNPLNNATVTITKKSDGTIQNLTFNNDFYENPITDFVVPGETYFLKVQYQSKTFVAETTVPNLTTVNITYQNGVKASIDDNQFSDDDFDFRPYFTLQISSLEKEYFYLHGAYRIQIPNPGSPNAGYPRYFNFETEREVLHLFTNIQGNKPTQNISIDRFIVHFYGTQNFLNSLFYQYEIRLLITDENYYEYHKALKPSSAGFESFIFSSGHVNFSNIENAFGVFGSFLDQTFILSSVDNPKIYEDVLKVIQ